MGGYKLRGRCGFASMAPSFLGCWFFWFASAVYWCFSVLSLSPCGSSLYTPYILLGALLSFAQYTTFMDQKKKKKSGSKLPLQLQESTLK